MPYFTLIKAINPKTEMRFRLAHPNPLNYSKCEGDEVVVLL